MLNLLQEHAWKLRQHLNFATGKRSQEALAFFLQRHSVDETTLQCQEQSLASWTLFRVCPLACCQAHLYQEVK